MTAPLSDALAVLAPGSLETLLLHACVSDGEIPGDLLLPRTGRDTPASHARQIVAPLLHATLRGRAALPIRAYLRAAALNEQVRWKEYESISRASLQALARSGITPVVVGGAALAETVYPRPALRHCDSVSLLVPASASSDAARCLEAHGFARAARSRPGATHTLLRHRSGMRLTLRIELLASPAFPLPADAVWARTLATEISGVPARRLAPADALVQVCVDGLVSRTPRTAQWALDAWYTVSRSPDLAWDTVGAAAHRAGAELPLLVALTYLAGTLAAPIPFRTLVTLRTAAARASSAARAACLSSTRRTPRVPVRRLLAACRTWRSRALVLQWLLCRAARSLRRHATSARHRPPSAAWAPRPLR